MLEDECGLPIECGEEGTSSAAREEESGGVGGACEELFEAVGGVAGVSHGGEREKAGESGEERGGESCWREGETDILQGETRERGSSGTGIYG